MTLKSNVFTETFDTEYEGFLIDIVETDTDFEAWIYQKQNGVKMFMFGIPQEQQSKEVFLNVVKPTLLEYIRLYLDEYGEE